MLDTEKERNFLLNHGRVPGLDSYQILAKDNWEAKTMSAMAVQKTLLDSQVAKMTVGKSGWKPVVLKQTAKVSPGILIVDADPANLRLVSTVIEEEGFNAVALRDGREARQVLRSNHDFVAAIFEVVIPHVSGPDLVRYMKREKGLRDIPVIMMTRSSSARLSFESFAAGAAILLPE